MGENNDNLKKMIKKYKPAGIDWMNFVLTRRNPYTFHHIVSKSDGGEDSVSNGAILTRKAHDLLHILEYACPEAYADLQEIFILINANKQPVDDSFMEKIDDILYRIFTQEGYTFIVDVDLSVFCDTYYHAEKKKKKILKK